MSEITEPAAPPVFEVSRGNPTDEELAAAITVLSLALAPRPNPRPASDRAVAGGWNSYYRVLRREHRSGRGAWGARF
ncbi:acyl-CoA carboxylase subunit epsilon [Propionibacteriaceae bacterium Y1923]|uniref:acyl-CoA carboxylase subunit epsilon n=1 Tax=Aestuariimicrobium sp. Y1814 TaxID=3418742 RepID=UPI003C2467E6